MKRISWKYLAGFIDGEGCLDMQVKHIGEGRINLRPRLRVSQAEPGKFILESLQASFGGRIEKRNRAQQNPAWMDAYSWQTEGRRMREILQNIVGHLQIKKQQARFVIWVIDNVMGKNVGENARQVIRDEMKAMKADPKRLSERAQERVTEFIVDRPWSKHSDKCLGCGTTEKKHNSMGYCQHCYNTVCKPMRSSVLAMRQSDQAEAATA